MPIGPARMPLREHLGELRMRLVRVVVVLLVAAIVFYLAANTMGQFLLAPIKDFLPVGEQDFASLVYLDPFEPFAVRFKIAMLMSVIATAPITLWQFLAFFLPALRPKERKWFVPTFIAMVLLFIVGTIFCYFIILYPAFAWLTDQAAGLGTIMPRATTYIDVIVKFEIGFGIAFELPLVIFYLVIFKIVPYKKLRGAWRYVYIGMMIFSAIVTPDANPITMLLMFAVLVALYELSLLLARIVLARRIKREQEEEAALEAELDAS